jgi:DNA-binding protein Fis
MSKKQIEEVVRHSLEAYFKDLRGAEPDQLHDMMIQVMESISYSSFAWIICLIEDL